MADQIINDAPADPFEQRCKYGVVRVLMADVAA